MFLGMSPTELKAYLPIIHTIPLITVTQSTNKQTHGQTDGQWAMLMVQSLFPKEALFHPEILSTTQWIDAPKCIISLLATVMWSVKSL